LAIPETKPVILEATSALAGLLTQITYTSKFIGAASLAALMQLQLFRVLTIPKTTNFLNNK